MVCLVAWGNGGVWVFVDDMLSVHWASMTGAHKMGVLGVGVGLDALNIGIDGVGAGVDELNVGVDVLGVGGRCVRAGYELGEVPVVVVWV